MKKRILSLFVPTLLNFSFALQAQIVSPYTITQYQEEACLTNQQNEEECSTIDLSLPIYKDQPWLNTYIIHNLIGDSQFQIDQPIEIQIKQFLSRAIADMIEYDAEYDSIETQLLGQTIIPKGHFQHFFALLNSNETYFKGAAHGNSEQYFYLLDTKTQKIVSLKALLVDAIAEKKLAKLQYNALQQLFKTLEIDIQEHFADDTWQFIPSTNFIPSKAGLTFLYNPYEIAPYALGTIEITVPKEALKGIVKAPFLEMIERWEAP
ncbi:hypothetical protein GCM10007162_12140 [Ignatzschineria ureiclastica]|nr:RsiV family protein [Ignatzschineria ureiclastica]GGZ97536.1 hypothetical protein GCM10007162_12140 [Ignatzschineria ureiclastica]